MAVYVDVLLAVNFAVDYLMLKAASLFCGVRPSGWRLVFGAALGAAASLVIFFPGGGAAAQLLYRAAVSLAVCAAAFCPCRAAALAKSALAVLISSFIFSGLVLLWQLAVKPQGVISYAGAVYFDIGAAALIICAAAGYIAACLLSRMLERILPSGRLCGVTVVNNGASVSFTALIDTGSSLAEPFSNAPVIVCELAALGAAAPKAVGDFCRGAEPGGGIRLVPYKTLDSSGLLPAFLPERLLLRRPDGSVADAGGCYLAAINGVLGQNYRAVCDPRALSYDNKAGDRVYEEMV